MATHLSEIELIELAGGKLSQATEAKAMAHLQACEPCAQRYGQTKETWQLLGQWDVAAPSLEPIAISTPKRDAPVSGGFFQWRHVADALRIAAVLALAAGVGVTAGWLSSTTGRGLDSHETAAWQDPTPWQVWHEPTPARLAEPMLSLVLEPDAEEPSS